MNKYSVILGRTYFNKGYFNAGLAASQNLSNHGETLKIILREFGEITAKINRTANRNGSVSIFGTNVLKKFI